MQADAEITRLREVWTESVARAVGALQAGHVVVPPTELVDLFDQAMRIHVLELGRMLRTNGCSAGSRTHTTGVAIMVLPTVLDVNEVVERFRPRSVACLSRSNVGGDSAGHWMFGRESCWGCAGSMGCRSRSR